jgi:hypothetical protein
MTLELNAGKLLLFFSPIWLLLVVALLVNPSAWSALQVAGVAGIPLVATAGLWVLGRRRWRLELTPEALVQHTLGRSERFDWAALGTLEIRGLTAVGPWNLSFAYPADPEGRGPRRRLMLVFGDQSGPATLQTIERFRQLYLKAPKRAPPTDVTLTLSLSWARLVKLLLPLFFVLGMACAAAATWVPALNDRWVVFAIAGIVIMLIYQAARRRIEIGAEELTLSRWGRQTTIAWMAIDEAEIRRTGVWPFRLPVLVLSWRGDDGHMRTTPLGDLYGDRSVEDLRQLILERHGAAVEAVNA